MALNRPVAHFRFSPSLVPGLAGADDGSTSVLILSSPGPGLGSGMGMGCALPLSVYTPAASTDLIDDAALAVPGRGGIAIPPASSLSGRDALCDLRASDDDMPLATLELLLPLATSAPRLAERERRCLRACDGASEDAAMLPCVLPPPRLLGGEREKSTGLVPCMARLSSLRRRLAPLSPVPMPW
jgi:hypothetical protein